MIEYVKGILQELTPASAIIETAGGVAYNTALSLASYSKFENSVGAEVRVYIHEVIREDAWLLYGFAEPGERELFRSLIGVSGVGAATALIILSSLQGEELAAVISGGDVKRLKSIKGIGAKTAERIIVDLRDKIKAAPDTLFTQTTQRSDAYDEALAALRMLGFDKKQSEKALGQLFDAEPTIKVEAAIKRALSMM